MPRQRRTIRRRGIRRTRRKPNVNQLTFRNVNSVAQAAYGAYKGYNYLKGIVNSEIKRFDHSASANMLTTGTITCLNQIVAGDDAIQRNGNSILGKYMTLNYSIVMDALAVHSNCRILLICDTNGQGAAPALSDILQITTAGYNIFSPINLDTTDRFTVLLDRRHGLSATGSQCVVSKAYRKLNFHIKFTGTASNTFQKNAIWIVYLSDNVSNPPALLYNSRLAYYDN